MKLTSHLLIISTSLIQILAAQDILHEATHDASSTFDPDRSGEISIVMHTGEFSLPPRVAQFGYDDYPFGSGGSRTWTGFGESTSTGFGWRTATGTKCLAGCGDLWVNTAPESSTNCAWAIAILPMATEAFRYFRKNRVA